MEEKENCWVVLLIQEDGTLDVLVCSSAEEAGMEAATWLAADRGSVDSYVPDMINAANDGDSSEFSSDNGGWFVRIFKRSIS